MTSKFPAVFVSHGAPSLLYQPGPARDFLSSLGTVLWRPQAILCVSAHWTTATPSVTFTPAPSLIYDFGGFEDELSQATYPVPGDPVLANRIINLLKNSGIEAGKDMRRGLDHGAWVPLKLIYPEATVPVLQLSVQPNQSPAHHLAVGQALRQLREEGVLILASGSATHNLADFMGRAVDSATPGYVTAFDEWLKGAIESDDRESLLDYRHKGPHAAANHPTPEHLLPLFVALGAGDSGRVLHRSYTYGVISMAAYAWE
jgi:4,5-DOPA dioxygenase extradiol